jgi:mannose-6-phosphate isomerase-like protein (cupin superfamily)
MHIKRFSSAPTRYEYGCDLQRVYPWEGVANPLWGAAIASVRPGETTTPDQHDESETFVIICGRGAMHIGAEREILETGDVVYIPKNEPHRIQNLSDTAPLVFISIFWDSPQALQRQREMVLVEAER